MSIKINDGGAAFPQFKAELPHDQFGNSPTVRVECGMTLRAYLAGQAIPAILLSKLSAFADGASHEAASEIPENAARDAVAVADALIAALEVKQ